MFLRWIFVVLLLLAPQATMAAVPSEDRPIAQLRVLDKITARVEQVDVRVEQPFRFGGLIITAHSCRVTPPEEDPESAAFLDISEVKADEGELPRFRGWMFASSPALSALEHPVYDLWVIGCKSEPTKESH